MSLITRCPECTTLFKVVQDQLRVSDGWVRCGQCGHVFDGSAHLLEVMLDPSDQAPSPSRHRTPGPSSSGPSKLAPPPRAVQTLQSNPEPDLSAFDGFPEVEKPKSEPLQSVDDVGFLRTARRKAFWQSPGLRWTVAVCNLLLLLLMAVQVVMFKRDSLAVQQPDLKPWLQAACDYLDCVVAVPKDIDAVLVDSSGFNAGRGDVYRFQVSLRNNSLQPTALPALELALTDSRDEVLLRKVLLPKDFPNPIVSLNPGVEWTGNLNLQVASAALPARIAGYKVLAFYP